MNESKEVDLKAVVQGLVKSENKEGSNDKLVDLAKLKDKLRKCSDTPRKRR